MPTSKIERLVLLAFPTHGVVSLASLREQVPQLKARSVTNALAFLKADRSVERVGHGRYQLTELGRIRAEESLGP